MTQNSIGVHQGRQRREQTTTFIPCTFLQRLPSPNTSLLSANTHETQPVISYLSPQLIYRWVPTIISSFLSLCPRSVWDLKLPQACWGAIRFHSYNLSLSLTRFALAYLIRPVTHITLVLHRKGGLGKKIPQVLEVPKLSVRFQPRSFAPSAFSQPCTPFPPPGHTVPKSPSALRYRIDPGHAAKVKLLDKLLLEKAKQGAKGCFHV